MAYITVFAVIAGFVTALIARRAEVRHALALGIVLLLLGVISVISASSGGNLWFPAANGILQFVAAIADGFLRAGRNSPNTPSEA